MKQIDSHRDAVRASPRSIRQWNEYAVVASLRENSPQRIADLAEATGLTAAPLGQVLKGLEDKGWVSVHQPATLQRGRPANHYSLHSPPGWVLGLDVGAHAVRVMRLSLAGEPVACAERRTRSGMAVVPELVREVTSDAALDDVWFAVAAVGGHLDADGTLLRSVAMPQWEGTRPADELAQLLGLRVTVVNDVRAVTRAEHSVGAAKGYSEVLLVHLGRRPTLGLLTQGTPYRGAHGTAGDLTAQSFFPTELEMAWVEPYRQGIDPLGDAVRAALAGDAAALAGARAYAASVAPPLAFAAAVLDPQVMVISGALSPLYAQIQPCIQAELEAHLANPPQLLPAQLDQFAAAWGAGLSAVEEIHRRLATPTHGVAEFSKSSFLALAHNASDNAG